MSTVLAALAAGVKLRVASLRGLRICLPLFCIALAHADVPVLRNELAGHASPYLAQHGTDAVAWQTWNRATLERARQENKPLLVSVGYFACHWCHVMQRESFRDAGIAALINRHFIPVKVDRELNPALDAELLEFTRRLHGAAGWPLQGFITPEGYPIYAVLYQPPEKFRAVVEKLARHWRLDAAAVRAAAQAASPVRQAAAHPLPASAHDLATLQARLLAAVWARADRLQGGFGTVSKFPNSPLLRHLLELQAQTADEALAEFIRLSLEQMARLGLHDAINGGFFRYTTDPDWQTPHFEKMLYDNAQLARVYARAAELFDNAAYRDIAHGTLDFLLEVLATPQGGFRSSVSALDRQGREGGAYLWQPEALRKRLSREQFRLLHRVWGMAAASPFEYGYLPMEKVSPGADRALLAATHTRLKMAGRMRGQPVDGKIDAGLNGLTLSALSLAGEGVPRFENAARRLRDYIAQQLMRDGELLKGRAGGTVFADAELDDYAWVAAGLLDHARTFDDAGSRALAGKLTAQAWKRFFTGEGWRRETRPLLATSGSHAALPDTATPSSSATLLSLGLALPGSVPADMLERALAHGLHSALADPFAHPGSLAALRQRFTP